MGRSLRVGGFFLVAGVAAVSVWAADRSSTLPSSSASAPAIFPATQPAIAPPPLSAEAPVALPGLPNVVTYTPDLIVGAAPEGDEGFETLRRMGIKSIITVDGSTPEIQEAHQFGFRYVHLPIGYDGMDADRALDIARAVADLPKPVYVHCHHGKHRGACAGAVAAVELGWMTNAQALAKMKISGTAPAYHGLFQVVRIARKIAPAELAAGNHAFPEIWKPSGLVQTMVHVDNTFDALKEIEKAGWKVPADHPDLVPAAQAGQLADLFRTAQSLEAVKAHPPEMAQWLATASEEATSVEEGLVQGKLRNAELSARLKRVAKSCNDCHAKYRN
jgi:protein tyrosine phosphatase (PTP) superfamily phosphohydrolase (DUF442 family)